MLKIIRGLLIITCIIGSTSSMERLAAALKAQRAGTEKSLYDIFDTPLPNGSPAFTEHFGATLVHRLPDSNTALNFGIEINPKFATEPAKPRKVVLDSPSIILDRTTEAVLTRFFDEFGEPKGAPFRREKSKALYRAEETLKVVSQIRVLPTTIDIPNFQESLNTIHEEGGIKFELHASFTKFLREHQGVYKMRFSLPRGEPAAMVLSLWITEFDGPSQAPTLKFPTNFVQYHTEVMNFMNGVIQQEWEIQCKEKDKPDRMYH